MLVTKGSFDSSDSSDSIQSDSIFQKYSTTPPTRAFKMKRKEPRMLTPVQAKAATSYSLDLDKPPKDARPKLTSSHKWQQKENSVQRSTERRIKMYNSLDTGMALQNGALSSDVSTSDDDSLNDKSPNQRIKVICLFNALHKHKSYFEPGREPESFYEPLLEAH